MNGRIKTGTGPRGDVWKEQVILIYYRKMRVLRKLIVYFGPCAQGNNLPTSIDIANRHYIIGLFMNSVETSGQIEIVRN